MASERAIIVGAGIGGLSAAVHLAARGLDVTVLEAAATPGGKMREVEAGGRRIDAGPTVMTMRPVFEALFEAAGARLDEHVRLVPAEILARHAWDERARLDLHADADRSADAIGAFAGRAEAERFRGFCRAAREVYRAAEGPFIRSHRPSFFGMPLALGPGGGLALMRNGFGFTMMRQLRRHFADPRLVQLFGRYATYCGSSPYAAPAILMLVAHVEQAGVFYVEGGMHRLARAIEALAARLGVRFRYGAAVAEIRVEHGRAAGVRLASGEAIAAEAVVWNGDVAALADGLAGPGARRAAAGVAPAARSLSAMTWTMTAEAQGFPLVRHGVFFGADYPAEFRAIFRNGRLPEDPTVYVCAQDRADDAAPTGGPERLLVLVNAPAVGDRRAFEPGEIEQCRHRTFARLERCGLTIGFRPEASVATTPADFARLHPGSGGALYGRANHGWLASFRRPGSRTALPGLYLAGGSVHPGPGIPMAALSGGLAAQAILADRIRGPASIGPSRPAVISGGISTP